METSFSEFISKIHSVSQTLDKLALVTDQYRVLIDDANNNKTVYIFRTNNELLIAENGNVEKAGWEHLGHNSFMICRKDAILLYRNVFSDETILILKIDCEEKYVFFVDESRYDNGINSVNKVQEFLNEQYVEIDITKISENTAALLTENKGEIKIPIHKPPVYKLKKVANKNCLYRGAIRKFHVQFDDGIKGIIYHITEDNTTYFKHEKPFSSSIVEYHYENIDCCIAALHLFYKTKTKNVYKKGRLEVKTYKKGMRLFNSNS